MAVGRLASLLTENPLRRKDRGTGREKDVLTPELREELEVIDLTAGQALGGDRRPKPPPIQRAPAGSGGQRSVAETAIPEGAGRILGIEGSEGMSAGEFLGSPKVRQTLLNIADVVDPTRAHVSEPMREGIRGESTQNLVGRLLAGENIEDIEGLDIAGLTSQDIAQAEDIVAQRGAGEREEERIDLQDRRLGISERLQTLRERGFELDEEKFNLSKRETELGIEMAEKEIARFERQNQVEDRITLARAGLLEVQTEALQAQLEGGQVDPALQKTLIDTTQDFIESMGDLTEQERGALATEQRALNEANERVRRASTNFFGQEQEVSEDLLEAQESQKEIVDNIRNTIENLQSRMKEAQQLQEQRLGFPGASAGEQEGEAASPEQGSEQPEGSLQNPVLIDVEDEEEFLEAFENMEPGTFGTRFGNVFFKDEQGNIQF